MPLRRLLPTLPPLVCLLGLSVGAATTPRPGAMPPAPPPASASPTLDVAQLEAAAQPFLQVPATLPAAPRDMVHDARGGAIELYHLRYEWVLASGLSTMVEQRVFDLPSASAAQFFALDDLWYDSARSRFVLLRAEVQRGSRQLPGSDGGNAFSGRSGSQPRRVLLPPLRAGDRVNVEYALLPDAGAGWDLLGGHYLGNLFSFADTYPTAESRYVLSAPGTPAINQARVAPPSISHEGGRQRWLWTARDVPAFFGAADGPAVTDVTPFVQVSGFHSWAAMADWYSSVLAQRARLDPELARTMAGVSSPPQAPPDAAATRAAVERVWRAVAARLQYRGDESGVHAFVPAPVGSVWSAGEGDCKDGALLLATWLRSAGIDSDLALVRTPDMGQLAPAAADGDTAATVAAFDHALVYVPATQQWIDTTANDFLDSELPSSDQDGLALIVRAGQQDLVRVPSAAASANLTRRDIRLQPLGEGWLQASGTISVQGADAPDLRRAYRDQAGREAALGVWLRPYFPNIEVQSVTAAGVSPAAPIVELSFTARVHAPSQWTPAWLPSNYTATLAAADARSAPLRVPLRWELDEAWRLQLGAGQNCAQFELPPASTRNSHFGAVQVRVSCDAGELAAHSQVLQQTQAVPAGGYGQYRGFWQSVDATLDAPLVLRQLSTPRVATAAVKTSLLLP